MAKSDEGEFELILGNRQLISVFLIVVVLLGVFFSMGYIVGRNSASPAAEAAHNAAKTVAVEPPSAEPTPSSTADTPAEEPAAKPAESVPAPSAPTSTHPEQPAPTKPSPVTPAPVTAVKPKPAAAGPASAGLASVTREPAPGQYWQVVATSRPTCEIIAEALTKKGFHALVAPAPREGVFRVLVGPFQDAAAAAQARTNLESAGFNHPITQRY